MRSTVKVLVATLASILPATSTARALAVIEPSPSPVSDQVQLVVPVASVSHVAVPCQIDPSQYCPPLTSCTSTRATPLGDVPPSEAVPVTVRGSAEVT